MKLLANRDRNTGELAAHECFFLLAISIGAELSLSGKEHPSCWHSLLSLCPLWFYGQGVI